MPYAFGAFQVAGSGGNQATADTIYQTWNAALKQKAVDNGVSCLSLIDYFGNYTAAFASARTVDGGHGNAGLYAEIAELEHQAIRAMAS